jgi:O-antigen ligase
MRSLQEGGAVTHAVVQFSHVEHPVTPATFEAQAKRATLIANAMASPPILNRLGRLMDVDPEGIAGTAELATGVPVAFNEPDGERRAYQISTSHDAYRLDIQPKPAVPMLDIYAQAPSAERAVELADSAVRAANAYLLRLARRHGEEGRAPVKLVQLGPARGGVLNATAPMTIAVLTFAVAFAVAFGLLFLVAEIRRGWLRAGSGPRPEAAPGDTGPAPAVELVPRQDDWPRTTRLLPWMIAAFIVMIWLVPINAITVQASLPVDLKLDRLVVPLIVGTWLLSLAAGGPGSPRWRFTTIHAGIGLFVIVAFLSVVLNATDLARALELDLVTKKLTLLAAFFSIFLVVASSVRPSEVRPFMTLILVLGAICAFGVIWEYRFGFNLFYGWSDRLLPGFFSVTAVDTTGYDEIGRRTVIGPAELGLEAVAMLSMALPIALVRFIHSNRMRERLLCGLAICLLLGAMIATYRKSAILAPIAICLILAYYRRRELLRLAPLGALILVAVPVLAPNALGSITEQFEPSRLTVATVSDRVSDYDAIRPDVLSHLAFGRGFGSYEHTTYRILDNDLLLRIVETGLVGLAAFILMIGLVFATAAPIIRRRDSVRAPPALAIAAAAGAFLVLSDLFDIMSFPHTPYILMTLLGLLAIIATSSEEEDRRARARPPDAVAADPYAVPAPDDAERRRVPTPA